jgi:16S rRNA methyltransferase gidB
MLPQAALELLERGLDALPFAVSPEQRAQLAQYLTLLNRWNAVHNLTAVRDPLQQVLRHVLDCLAVVPYLEDAHTLADIGSGAGLPALLLAVMRPQLAVLAVESNGKKAAFIRQAATALQLRNVQVAAQRAEDWRGAPQDIIISRALTSATAFVQMTTHFGGAHSRWLLMKGREAENVEAAGFTLHAAHPLQVPYLDAERVLLDIRRGNA